MDGVREAEEPVRGSPEQNREESVMDSEAAAAQGETSTSRGEAQRHTCAYGGGRLCREVSAVQCSHLMAAVMVVRYGDNGGQ